MVFWFRLYLHLIDFVAFEDVYDHSTTGSYGYYNISVVICGIAIGIVCSSVTLTFGPMDFSVHGSNITVNYSNVTVLLSMFCCISIQ